MKWNALDKETLIPTLYVAMQGLEFLGRWHYLPHAHMCKAG